ncbi:putative Chitin synthase D [Glarea lozoyensis 74030]|uniref:Putative Chitin synthase D n=1 Tax=Glarea lozoyensis (strain ATCC 74030 / MF5533) TaxID=1104152 RepID=H0EG15_GLAL7|nr:putative Chitin synthase D [Glarea lozoyensis 74030]
MADEGSIDSVVDCDYPPSCIHVFLSFDGDQEDELYLNTIEKLGVPLSLDTYPKSIDVTYRTARITVSRFPHGGKRHCQKATFKLIDKVYTEYLKRNDNLFILFIDSDCILDRVCLQNFVYDMELSPGNTRDMLAMTGVITSTTKKHSLITLLQDMEYIHAFRRMAKYYFADKAEQCEDLFDYGKCHLGEDRWLTHLFMIGAKKRYQIQMSLLFFIMLISIISTSKKIKDLPVGFIGISLGLNWLMMIYFGAKLKRFKIWLYPLMFIINPFFNWYYMVYGIFTAGQRTWGGPRADAGSADASTTPQQAIEKADAQGDDLNVVPETFKPAADAQSSALVRTGVPLQPPDKLEGRFAAAEKLPGGWYLQNNDSLVSQRIGGPSTSGPPRMPIHPRDSFDSNFDSQSSTNSVYMPRRVESIMGEEDKKKYAIAQASQRAAGGAYMTEPFYGGHVYELTETELSKGGFKDSVESFQSYQDRPDHRQLIENNTVHI